MRIALVVPGGVDRSGRHRVIPAILFLIERLARRHEVHVFVLRHYQEPCTYQLVGATVHDLGRASGPSGLKSILQARRLVGELKRAGPFDVTRLLAVPANSAVLAGRRRHIPTVATFDSGEPVCLQTIDYGSQCLAGRLSVALTGRLATRVHVCSHYGRPRATAGRRSCAPLGASAPSTAARAGRRAAVEAAPRGQPRRVKDQATLLRALARVVSVCRRCTWTSSEETRWKGPFRPSARRSGSSAMSRFMAFSRPIGCRRSIGLRICW